MRLTHNDVSATGTEALPAIEVCAEEKERLDEHQSQGRVFFALLVLWEHLALFW